MLVVVALRIGVILLYNESRLCVIQDGHGIGRVVDMILFAIQIWNQKREIS